jgi:hypothetical protein
LIIAEAVALGYNAGSARQAMRWTVGRIALHTGIGHAREITDDHITEALEAIRLFSERDDLHHFYPSPQNFLNIAAKQWITRLHQLQVVLFHRGQVATQPRKLMPSWKPPLVLPPRMQAVADKWLAARRLTDAPATVEKLEIAVRRFGEWLAEHHPVVVSYADVTRDHCLAWAESLAEVPTEKTGRPLGEVTRIQRISGLSQLFRDTAAWEYDDIPGFAPITSRSASHGSSPTTNSTWSCPSSTRSPVGSSGQPYWSPAGPEPVAMRSGTCRSTAWTTTPTGRRACGCPAERRPNSSKVAPLRTSTPDAGTDHVQRLGRATSMRRKKLTLAVATAVSALKTRVLARRSVSIAAIAVLVAVASMGITGAQSAAAAGIPEAASATAVQRPNPRFAQVAAAAVAFSTIGPRTPASGTSPTCWTNFAPQGPDGTFVFQYYRNCNGYGLWVYPGYGNQTPVTPYCWWVENGQTMGWLLDSTVRGVGYNTFVC